MPGGHARMGVKKPFINASASNNENESLVNKYGAIRWIEISPTLQLLIDEGVCIRGDPGSQWVMKTTLSIKEIEYLFTLRKNNGKNCSHR